MKIAALALVASGIVATSLAERNPVPVTVDNFARAESDLYMSRTVKQGGFGKFEHNRTAVELDNQPVIRMNRDTLYSAAVFDLDAGQVTIKLPNAGKRFMSMQIINEDHYAPIVVYQPASLTLTRDKVGTRYVMAAVRTLVDPNDPKDVDQVRALQDEIKVSVKNPGKFEIPDWDETSQKQVRDALLVLAAHTDGIRNAFGTREHVDPVSHLLGTAAGWGGNPESAAFYSLVTPAKNDGSTIYKLNVPGNVPVEGFWSISVYNADGYFEQNAYDAYSLNDITANKAGDGSVAVQFGGCDGKIPNCLPITKGWNYTVRLYRPLAQVLDGSWKFPEAQPVDAGTVGSSAPPPPR